HIQFHSGAKIFVLKDCDRLTVLNVHDLGASDYFARPLDGNALIPVIREAVNRKAEAGWNTLSQTQRAALRVSLKCFENSFQNVHQGEPLSAEEIKETAQQVLQATASGQLDSWMDALRGHHSYTFRHSMFVCGVVSAFAQAIGIGSIDTEILIQGALLHDIGKARVPLEILDKPSALTEVEWNVMRAHPEYSRDLMQGQGELDPRIVSMAVHHHERLDGDGYPDGLCGAAIDDHVRLISIGDVYSALVDKRAYKPPLEKEQAISIMKESKGQLDLKLIAAFSEFILDGDSGVLIRDQQPPRLKRPA
ncbi:MAG: HD domain-containing phosphohydrolase, partial [Pseudomonadota bacterium]